MARRLDSLEMQGVKTFATTTRLEFPGQITAIVGPNGSGKSNIADSIQWVLGEQSYSSLRAKKTEDIIFSGSQQRPRAGMASATITFNNEEGWLPIDYAEVSISRRAYRDGQNEYLLNGQKVRLKDISELLSQTGLAERTYTIIGQGLVDVALALKPDERRKLFEEAAGIGLYQSRKDESIRRLENTQKNLDRVLDIIAEIRPRLRSLEKQSKRFVEFQQLRVDLEELLKQWYGYHWHQKQQELNNARKAFKEQEISLETIREEHQEIARQVEESRLALQLKRKALEDAHHALSTVHQQLQQSNRDLAILEERQRSHVQQKSNLEIDIANVQEEIKELESQEEGYQSEIQIRIQELRTANENLESIKVKLEEVSSQKETIQQKFNTARKNRIVLETEKVQISAKIEELLSRRQSLTKEKSKIDDSIKNLEEKRQEFVTKNSDLEKLFEEKQIALREINENLDEHLRSIEKLKIDRDHLDHELASKENFRAKLATQFEVLNQAEAALSGYSQGSKTIIDYSRNGNLPSGIEPISQHLVVEERYEKAIGAALGELTDLLVVPSSDANFVIEFLENKEHDRVALVLSGENNEGKRDRSLQNSDGFIGYANDLIAVDEGYRPVVDDLCSDILVMNDRHSAKKIQTRLVGNQKAVTLNGIVFQSNGVVISGQSQTGKRIGRTRQLSEIQNSLKELGQTIKQLEDDKLRLISQIQEVQVKIDAINLNHQSAEATLEQAQDTLRSGKDSQTRIDEQINWHQERMMEIRNNLDATNQALTEAKETLIETEAKITKVHEEEEQISFKIEELPIFEIQQEVNQSQTHCIVAENALKAIQLRFDDHHGRLEEARKRFSTYQTRLEGSNERIEEVVTSEGTLKESIQELNAVISQMENEKIDPLTTESGELEKEVVALEKQENEHHQSMINAERRYTQFQLELGRNEDQLKNLRERIESDFGLVLFEYEENIEGPTPLPFEDGFVKTLPRISEVPESTEPEMKRLKTQIRRIGAVNPEAQREYIEVKERFEFLNEQVTDLETASRDLHDVINELDVLMERDFIATFKAVNKEFGAYFTRLFNGGEASLVFSDEDNPVEGGVDIVARLPGRRSQGLALLSGGERSLTAVALIFALLKVSPTPFCVLDEVDAMLDESNVGRFIELLRDLSVNTQFVIITHNRNTVQAADVIYGVTMGRDSTSQMISLKLEEVDETFLE
jgi:chromosome segregation protein